MSRYNGIYGPRQSTDLKKGSIIPVLIRRAMEFPKQEYKILTQGQEKRAFCYIDDAINAIFLALKSKKTNGEIFNIGSGKPIKIKKVVTQICKIIGKGKPQFGKIKYRKNENMTLYPKVEKARIRLKWKPKIKFNFGIKILLKSYKCQE